MYSFWNLFAIANAVSTLETEFTKMANELADLQTAVANIGTATTNVEAAVQALIAKISSAPPAGVDPAAVEQAAQTLNNSFAALNQAVQSANAAVNPPAA